MDVNTAAKDMLFSTLRIVAHRAGEEPSRGTGFVMDLELFDDQSTPILVTNKHVVDDAEYLDVEFFVADGRGGVVLGNTVTIRFANGSESFLGHPTLGVDVAVAPIGNIIQAVAPDRLFFRAVPASFLPTAQTLTELDAIEDLTLVGYPDGRWDELHKTPIVRRGITATPVQIDFDGRPCFLLDGSVFAGSSGSPVFVYTSGGFAVGQQFAIGHRMILVGVLAETLTRDTTLQFGFLDSLLKQEINLGVVFNWRAIEEAIDALCRHADLERPPHT
jgi:hypothetical protein